MSTGNNQSDTLVSKKRKRILAGYIHPNKPEIKKFDFFNGDRPDAGTFRTHNSKEFIATYDPVGLQADQVGCYTLVTMANPAQGTASNERIGMKYNLKYIKFKGHIGISPSCPFTVRYKLLLIKTDYAYSTADAFFAQNYCNYQPFPAVSNFGNIESYCRHNFYKPYKWALGMAEHRTSVMVVSSGTLSPVDYIPKPTKSSTLGSQPGYTYTVPDMLRIGNSGDAGVEQVSYCPLNVSVQVNDNVEVGTTHFYLMLLTDHGIGVNYPYYSQGVQYYYAATSIANLTPVRINFFGVCYYTDL